MTYKELRKNKTIREFIKKGNEILGVMGYTDHSQEHCILVAERAAMILKTFEYGAREIELAKMAGYMHDIGNAVNRKQHAEYGALLAGQILEKTDMELADRVEIIACIANHDETTGVAFDAVSAALILADKTDVRRNRVRTKEISAFDIHDRVNYAVTEQKLRINREKNTISLNLQIDESICNMCEYFEIFLQRMLMCRKASEVFGAKFKLTANGSKII